MRKIIKRFLENFSKGKEVGLFWFKTSFYYVFMPMVLYLGNIFVILPLKFKKA